MNLLTCFSVLILASLALFWYWIAYRATFIGNFHHLKSPLIIFDFDGTICPSYPLFIDQVNFLADAHKLRKIGADEIEKFRNMAPKNIMKILGISPFKLPFLLKKARRNVQKQLLELKPVAGIVDVLQELKRRGCSLGILTSNSPENVLLYLQKYQLDVFDFVCTGKNIFGKERHLKEILKKTRLNPEKNVVIYVGDEIRDVHAAQKAHLTSMGVTWGYNSSTFLQESHPTFLLESPSQILSTVQRYR
jgi:phosphoglycolate phosphatase